MTWRGSRSGRDSRPSSPEPGSSRARALAQMARDDGRLHGDHAGGEADRQHDQQHPAGARAQAGLQSGRDRVGVLPGHHRAEVGDRQHAGRALANMTRMPARPAATA